MNRTRVAALSLSAAALVGIAVHEGFKPNAYIPVPGDVPTIGFGTTENVKMGDKVTVERGLVLLLEDANEFERAVKRCSPVPMYQHEFDSFVSLTYNIGAGAYCKSTLVTMLKAGDYTGACKQILRWDRFKGKPLRGLTIRRQQEYQKCIGS